ncbi:GFA family protein [Novosphingobium sp. NBM11]|uniref:GFA family protein n=1 Tax=Novosphingobium sp. NBM11 TaxID=2596914 RepID=UPI00189219EE|nr:GFA family protein [Novosphingobium sp. NBM11]MBF5090016.1 GFA family protein [Novosphingobium sp. NBM11]
MAIGDVVTGGCACGAVRWRAVDRGFRPYACHCKGCQTRQGSAFALNQQVLVADLVTEGAPIEGTCTGSHSATVTHVACPSCMTRLYTINHERPEIATIRTGTRDDSPDLVPVFHVWTSRKQPWIALPDDVPQLETQPATREEWMALVLPA